MQIVVAQDRYGTISQCLNKPQYLQRLRATVHQITSKPEPIAGTIKVQTVEQGKQGRKTALYIANSVNGHRCLSYGASGRGNTSATGHVKPGKTSSPLSVSPRLR